MLLWVFFSLLLIAGFRLAFAGVSALSPVSAVRGGRREIRGARAALLRLHEIQETIEAGVVPEESRWESLRSVPEPWGPLSSSVLGELRASGASVLPTLRRLRNLAEEYISDRVHASTRTAQGILQAVVCALLVPVFGASLYGILPGLQPFGGSWLAACCLAMLLSGLAALWMVSMADRAGWGGLAHARRRWMLESLVFGERVLARVRCGAPADLAWSRSIDALMGDTPDLASLWGADIWADPGARPVSFSAGAVEGVIVEAGASMKRAIQASIAEGRPCTERLETQLRALRTDLRGAVEREVGLLGTRALKPLFLLVAPSLFGLIATGGYLTWMSIAR